MNTTERIARSPFIVLAAAAAVLLAAVAARGGQDTSFLSPPTRWEMGLTLGGAFPMGAFQQNLGTIGGSVDFYLGHRLGRSPLIVGVDVYFMLYGDRTHDEGLSGAVPLEVQVETSNNVVQGLFYLKCQPLHGRVRPYLEALVGGSYLYTETSISGTEYPYDEIASSTNFDDFTFCAGGGAGLDIHLGGGRRTAGGSRAAEIWLDLKVRYLCGGRAQYLRPDSIVYDSDRGTFSYLFRESTTNLLSAQVGVALTF